MRALYYHQDHSIFIWTIGRVLEELLAVECAFSEWARVAVRSIWRSHESLLKLERLSEDVS